MTEQSTNAQLVLKHMREAYCVLIDRTHLRLPAVCQAERAKLDFWHLLSARVTVSSCLGATALPCPGLLQCLLAFQIPSLQSRMS